MESWRKNPLVFWALNLPPAFWLVVFFVIPLGIIWVISFGEKRGSLCKVRRRLVTADPAVAGLAGGAIEVSSSKSRVALGSLPR